MKLVNDPGPWQAFIKRSDNVGLPINEITSKYITEQNYSITPAGRNTYYDSFTPFISTWDTTATSVGSSNNNQIRLPLNPIGRTQAFYDFRVNWGDGTFDYVSNFPNTSLIPNITHTYATAGTYVISIQGVVAGWCFNNSGDRRKIRSISQWGCLKLGHGIAQFFGCDNMTLNNITDTPDLTSLTGYNTSGPGSLSNTFRSCSLLVSISRANEWDTSRVENMSLTFYSNYRFNQDLGSWNVGNVTDFSYFLSMVNYIFTGSFNNGGSDSIKNWNTSKATNMLAMFQLQPSFNQPIGSWDVSNVTNFTSTFLNCWAFNQPLSSWNTSKATNMSNMFNTSSFNQPIGNWDVSNVTDMSFMFYANPSFNQDLGSWNVGNVRNFSYTFGGFNNSRTSSFNNGGSDSIKNWNTSNATNMNGMFYSAPQFNQPIGSWNVGNVTNMLALFAIAYGTNTGSFNQPLNSWNTSKVTDMGYVFAGQTNFNQNIGSWDTSNVTNMLHMFNNPSNMPKDGVFNNGGDPSIKNWNVSKVKEMSYMFGGQPFFNQEIGTWNVSALTSSVGMFNAYTSPRSASQFNNSGSNSIRNWNTINLKDATTMFQTATSFTQPLGGWNITSLTTASSFMSSKTFSDYPTSSYDDILIGWASQSAKLNVSINFGTIKYSSAATASRGILTGSYNWTIVDGGLQL